MKIDPKYKMQMKIKKLLQCFRINHISWKRLKKTNISLNDSDAAKSLTKLADEAEETEILNGVRILIFDLLQISSDYKNKFQWGGFEGI